MQAPYSEADLKEKLKHFPAWTLDEDTNKLTSGFEFEDFNQAIEFVDLVATVAEQVKHHPDIFVYDFKFVSLLTSTHDAEGVTDIDFEFIQKLEDSINESDEE